ncbi:hypothetical protein SNEBB_005669 [Seison nebaliae]|nr:hypothetical protein SNEBB_005669 [Seison nebaliae]
MDEYNPFSDPFADSALNNIKTISGAPTIPVEPTIGTSINSYQPPINTSTNATGQQPPPPPTNQFNAPTTNISPFSNYGTGQDQKTTTNVQETDLEKREAEIQRRERELNQRNSNQNPSKNFPPLPSFIPCGPCFRQDIQVDIPPPFQQIVKYMFYLWIIYAVVLLLNVFGCLMLMIAEKTGSSSGSTFGWSILYIVFIPLSYVCWFQPVYQAFKKNSSFNFMLFFFVFFIQFLSTVIQALGLPGWGTSGFITALSAFKANGAFGKFVGIYMIILSIVFVVLAIGDFLMLVKIHRIYRNTDASMAKAQQEFASGLWKNPATTRVAGQVISNEIRNTTGGGPSPY